MLQTIRITITPELEHALHVLRQSTFGTLNTTEIVKLAVGEFAHIKKMEMSANQLDRLSSRSFYQWAKEDSTLETDNIAHPEKLKPFKATTHVRTR